MWHWDRLIRWASWTPTRADLRSGASPRDTLTRATLPAAPPQALRAIHSRRLASGFQVRLSPGLRLTASHPRVGMGNAFRGLGCAGPGEPATDPHSSTRNSLPTLGRYRDAGGQPELSAFGASASRRRRRVSVPPSDFSGPVPSVHSPIHPSDSALCSSSARCLTATVSTS